MAQQSVLPDSQSVLDSLTQQPQSVAPPMPEMAPVAPSYYFSPDVYPEEAKRAEATWSERYDVLPEEEQKSLLGGILGAEGYDPKAYALEMATKVRKDVEKSRHRALVGMDAQEASVYDRFVADKAGIAEPMLGDAEGVAVVKEAMGRGLLHPEIAKYRRFEGDKALRRLSRLVPIEGGVRQYGGLDLNTLQQKYPNGLNLDASMFLTTAATNLGDEDFARAIQTPEFSAILETIQNAPEGKQSKTPADARKRIGMIVKNLRSDLGASLDAAENTEWEVPAVTVDPDSGMKRQTFESEAGLEGLGVKIEERGGKMVWRFKDVLPTISNKTSGYRVTHYADDPETVEKIIDGADSAVLQVMAKQQEAVGDTETVKRIEQELDAREVEREFNRDVSVGELAADTARGFAEASIGTLGLIFSLPAAGGKAVAGPWASLIAASAAPNPAEETGRVIDSMQDVPEGSRVMLKAMLNGYYQVGRGIAGERDVEFKRQMNEYRNNPFIAALDALGAVSVLNAGVAASKAAVAGNTLRKVLAAGVSGLDIAPLTKRPLKATANMVRKGIDELADPGAMRAADKVRAELEGDIALARGAVDAAKRKLELEPDNAVLAQTVADAEAELAKVEGAEYSLKKLAAAHGKFLPALQRVISTWTTKPGDVRLQTALIEEMTGMLRGKPTAEQRKAMQEVEEWAGLGDSLGIRRDEATAFLVTQAAGKGQPYVVRSFSNGKLTPKAVVESLVRSAGTDPNAWTPELRTRMASGYAAAVDAAKKAVNVEKVMLDAEAAATSAGRPVAVEFLGGMRDAVADAIAPVVAGFMGDTSVAMQQRLIESVASKVAFENMPWLGVDGAAYDMVMQNLQSSLGRAAGQVPQKIRDTVALHQLSQMSPIISVNPAFANATVPMIMKNGRIKQVPIADLVKTFEKPLTTMTKWSLEGMAAAAEVGLFDLAPALGAKGAYYPLRPIASSEKVMAQLTKGKLPQTKKYPQAVQTGLAEGMAEAQARVQARGKIENPVATGMLSNEGFAQQRISDYKYGRKEAEKAGKVVVGLEKRMRGIRAALEKATDAAAREPLLDDLMKVDDELRVAKAKFEEASQFAEAGGRAFQALYDTGQQGVQWGAMQLAKERMLPQWYGAARAEATTARQKIDALLQGKGLTAAREIADVLDTSDIIHLADAPSAVLDLARRRGWVPALSKEGSRLKYLFGQNIPDTMRGMWLSPELKMMVDYAAEMAGPQGNSWLTKAARGSARANSLMKRANIVGSPASALRDYGSTRGLWASISGIGPSSQAWDMGNTIYLTDNALWRNASSRGVGLDAAMLTDTVDGRIAAGGVMQYRMESLRKRFAQAFVKPGVEQVPFGEFSGEKLKAFREYATEMFQNPEAREAAAAALRMPLEDAVKLMVNDPKAALKRMAGFGGRATGAGLKAVGKGLALPFTFWDTPLGEFIQFERSLTDAPTRLMAFGRKVMEQANKVGDPAVGMLKKRLGLSPDASTHQLFEESARAINKKRMTIDEVYGPLMREEYMELAVKEGREVVGDYGNKPKWMRFLTGGSTGIFFMPYATFPLKMAPRLAGAMMSRPTYYLLANAMNQGAQEVLANETVNVDDARIRREAMKRNNPMAVPFIVGPDLGIDLGSWTFGGGIVPNPLTSPGYEVVRAFTDASAGRTPTSAQRFSLTARGAPAVSGEPLVTPNASYPRQLGELAAFTASKFTPMPVPFGTQANENMTYPRWARSIQDAMLGKTTIAPWLALQRLFALTYQPSTEKQIKELQGKRMLQAAGKEVGDRAANIGQAGKRPLNEDTFYADAAAGLDVMATNNPLSFATERAFENTDLAMSQFNTALQETQARKLTGRAQIAGTPLKVGDQPRTIEHAVAARTAAADAVSEVKARLNSVNTVMMQNLASQLEDKDADLATVLNWNLDKQYQYTEFVLPEVGKRANEVVTRILTDTAPIPKGFTQEDFDYIMQPASELFGGKISREAPKRGVVDNIRSKVVAPGLDRVMDKIMRRQQGIDMGPAYRDYIPEEIPVEDMPPTAPGMPTMGQTLGGEERGMELFMELFKQVIGEEEKFPENVYGPKRKASPALRVL